MYSSTVAVYLVQVSRNGNSLQVTIPRPLVKAWRLRRGEQLALALEDGRLLLARVDERKMRALLERAPGAAPGADETR